MSTPFDNVAYVSLETFRKDGSGVQTPVWIAPLDGKLVIGTGGSSFKVKRIRNNSRVRLATCNASGKQILGPWYEGKARIVDATEAERGDAALTAKYGLQRRLLTFFAKLSGRIKDRAIIEVTLEGEAGKNG
ncbi:MAG: PPOX class F420-dependent oxidoreductase [Pseudoxanthomonas sp.]